MGNNGDGGEEAVDRDRFMVAECVQEGDSGDTTIEANVSGEGVSLVLWTPREQATSHWISWQEIAQAIIERKPDLFGDLSVPGHGGFGVAMKSLRFHVPRTRFLPGGFAGIVSYFEREHEGYFTVDEEAQSVHQTVLGDSGKYQVAVAWDESMRWARLLIRGILTIPQPRRVAACELANLVNWGLSVGNFEIDLCDGELALRMSLGVVDGVLGYEQMDTHFKLMVHIADRFAPAFHRLIWADITPEAALASLET